MGNPGDFWDADGRLSFGETPSGVAEYFGSLGTRSDFEYRLAQIVGQVGDYSMQAPQRSWASRAGHFAADAMLNSDLLQQSWYEMRHPDFSSPLGIRTFETAVLGAVFGGADIAGNVVSLGGKAVIENAVKTGIKGVVEAGEKQIAKKLAQTGAGGFAGSADEMYNAIRASATDIDAIAANTGFKPSNIQKVKEHLFLNEHTLDRFVRQGEPARVGRFESDISIAEAWNRLVNGRHTAADVQLLRHETAEAWFMRRHGPSYDAAHTAADRRYPLSRN
ncbi:MAG TPA: hypothetical protein VJ063_13955 [Verrucomicrobiae bacterium]|nr:hypothetical protein [Verrucomicrobiae bacterium]